MFPPSNPVVLLLQVGLHTWKLFSAPADSHVTEKGPAGAQTGWTCPPDWLWFAHFIN